MANLALLCVLVVIAAVLFRRRKRPGGLPLPPGPKPLPIVGNLLDMPTKRLAPILRDLGKKYGDMTYFDMLGQPMVILNTYEAAAALLDGHSANTSDRPRVVMAELTGYTWEFALEGYTQRWRVRRKAFHSLFQQQTASSYQHVHVRECHRFLQRLLGTPEDFAALARHVFSATILDAVYGIKVAEQNDFYVGLGDKTSQIFVDIMIPGRYLVELLPFLKHIPSWFPGAGFKRDALRWYPDVLKMRDAPYEDTLKAIAQGTARPSMLSALYEATPRKDGKISPEDDEILRDATGLAYSAGADTSVYATRGMFLAMVRYPDVQKNAQRELDAVVGPDRLPAFSDRESLPYVNAIVKEVLRWHSVVPLGVYHRAMEEDECNGYRIPAGSILVPNAWAMSRDPDMYPEPDEFIPERFMEGGKYSATARDPEKFQFGFGRRICPGRHFAVDALFIIAASLLHVFDIAPPLGEDGAPTRVPPNINLDYFSSWPEPFECKITPRSKQAEALIRNATQRGE